MKRVSPKALLRPAERVQACLHTGRALRDNRLLRVKFFNSLRSVAQFGRALLSGSRGRRFESCHSDHISGVHIVKPYIFFITGASGAGKSTLLQALKAEVSHSDIAYLHFDSIGVPSENIMIEKYGSGSNWQLEMTHKWLQKITDNYSDKKIVILEGQINLDFIVEACEQAKITSYQIILIDCDTQIRHHRLNHERKQPHLINKDMDNWADFLKRQAQYRHALILNNSTTDIKGNVNLLKELIKT